MISMARSSRPRLRPGTTSRLLRRRLSRLWSRYLMISPAPTLMTKRAMESCGVLRLPRFAVSLDPCLDLRINTRPAADAPLTLCPFQASAHPFNNHRPLKFREDAHHLEQG